MKYIKPYNESIKFKSEYFTEVSNQEWHKSYYNNVDFTEDEINMIKEYYPNFAIQGAFITIHYLNLEIDIIKCSDEWFYTKIKRMYNPPKLYRCDQIEGVIELIKWFIN